MELQFILIIVSAGCIFAIYAGRIFSKKGGTFLFPQGFLLKADEALFGIIKFIFKMSSLLSHNVIAFLGNIPHAVVQLAHKVSQKVTQYTHILTEKFKNTGEK